jgi:hypothetical protein
VSDDDILGKADALLKRHSQRPGTDTGGVPLLTDLVEAPAPDAAPADPLAREVFTRVMAHIEGRLASDLHGRVAKELAPYIQSAVASAIGALRQEISQAVSKAVSEALEARQVK